jgi:hypothetical protein
MRDYWLVNVDFGNDTKMGLGSFDFTEALNNLREIALNNPPISSVLIERIESHRLPQYLCDAD